MRFVPVVLAMAALAIAPASAGAAALGAYWPFDEACCPTAVDAARMGGHGQITGAVRVPGRFGRALHFDGAGDDVRVKRSPTLEPAQVTLEAWVRNAGSPGDHRHIASIGADGCIAASYGMSTGPSGGIGFYISDGAGTFVRSPQVPIRDVWNGAWHHVAGTYDGAGLRFYLDGVEFGSGTPTTMAIGYATTPATDLLMGRYGGSCSLEYTGDIDEVRVWKRAFAPAEVAASHAMSAGSADLLAMNDVQGDPMIYTRRFLDQASVVISTESASGTKRIQSVALTSAPGVAQCGPGAGLQCTIARSNGDRTARLKLTPGIGSLLVPSVTLRTTFVGGGTLDSTLVFRR